MIDGSNFFYSSKQYSNSNSKKMYLGSQHNFLNSQQICKSVSVKNKKGSVNVEVIESSIKMTILSLLKYSKQIVLKAIKEDIFNLYDFRLQKLRHLKLRINKTKQSKLSNQENELNSFNLVRKLQQQDIEFNCNTISLNLNSDFISKAQEEKDKDCYIDTLETKMVNIANEFKFDDNIFLQKVKPNLDYTKSDKANLNHEANLLNERNNPKEEFCIDEKVKKIRKKFNIPLKRYLTNFFIVLTRYTPKYN